MKKMEIDDIIKESLAEDIGSGDVTSESTIPREKETTAIITSKESGIICGIDIAEKIFHHIDEDIIFKNFFSDGDKIKKGDIIVEISGNARSLLTAERTVLNFLQRLSGIASTARKYQDQVDEFNVKILDTRKTSPLLRPLEKYAVKTGGGVNHRMGLFDMVLIKDNHIKVAGSITKAIELAKKRAPNLKIEVETENLDMVKEAVNCSPDRIMLDNMSPELMKQCVKYIRENEKEHIEIEASGGINFKNIKEKANTGINFISIGSALTNGSRNLDLSMNIKL